MKERKRGVLGRRRCDNRWKKEKERKTNWQGRKTKRDEKT